MPCIDLSIQNGKWSATYTCAACLVTVYLDSAGGRRVTATSQARVPLWDESPPENLDPGDPPVIKGSVIGYRAWRLDMALWLLKGTYGPAWVNGEATAKCMSHHHVAPDADCECGLYGLARFTEKSKWWVHSDLRGAIEAWTDSDRFFVHDGIGFRAERAKIVLLALDPDAPRAKQAVIRALATEYGAGVCRPDHLKDAALEHGRLIPDAVLDWSRGKKEWKNTTTRRGYTRRRLLEG